MFALYSRSHKGLNLSPAERSILRFIDGAVITFIVGAVLAAYQQLAVGHVTWQTLGFAALMGGLYTVINAGLKYVRAHKDNPIVAAAEQPLQMALGAIMTAERENDIKQPIEEPDFINNDLPTGFSDPTDPNATAPASASPASK